MPTMNETGIQNFPRDWQPFALLLIDVQRDFWEHEYAQQFPHFPENTARLLDFCRTEGIEVIHVRALFEPDQSDWMVRYRLRGRIPCIRGTRGAEVLPFAQERPGETVILKHSFDAFLAPDLLPHLLQRQKRFVLAAGLVTSTCVFLSVASAMQRGFLTALVEDCCADDPAEHEQILETYPFIFSRVLHTQLADQHAQWLADLNQLNPAQHPSA